LQALNGEVDVAILRGEFQWSGKKILLTRERVCAIVSEADRGKSFHDLQFISRSTDSSFEREIARWFHENKFPMEEQGIHVDSITTCVEMVRRGIGWTIVPEICLEGFDGLIMPLSFVNGEPFTRSTYLMYMDSVAELPQVSAFITTITEIEKQAKTNE
jgi:DNA-binding transcriptional LysR family regulator